MTLVRGANGFFQTMEPWKLKKEGKIDKLNATLAVTMETARVVGTLLQPIVPSYSERLLGKLISFRMTKAISGIMILKG
jgi:methionyl-tRNA synthetase